jgi:hypothetical protein
MNLLQIRTKFRSVSGRYDLVNDNFSDNGANFFIEEGRKWLDSKVDKKMIHEATSKWASDPLVNDTDTNFWSINHPMTLIQAAVLQTQRTSGNKVMKGSFEQDLVDQLTGIDMDYIEHHVKDINQMEDSDIEEDRGFRHRH